MGKRSRRICNPKGQLVHSESSSQPVLPRKLLFTYFDLCCGQACGRRQEVCSRRSAQSTEANFTGICITSQETHLHSLHSATSTLQSMFFTLHLQEAIGKWESLRRHDIDLEQRQAQISALLKEVPSSFRRLIVYHNDLTCLTCLLPEAV